jgi:hypothetical protein
MLPVLVSTLSLRNCIFHREQVRNGNFENNILVSYDFYMPVTFSLGPLYRFVVGTDAR